MRNFHDTDAAALVEHLRLMPLNQVGATDTSEITLARSTNGRLSISTRGNVRLVERAAVSRFETVSLARGVALDALPAELAGAVNRLRALS